MAYIVLQKMKIHSINYLSCLLVAPLTLLSSTVLCIARMTPTSNGGLIAVQGKTGWGFMTSKGEIKVGFEWADIGRSNSGWGFHEGLSAVMQNGKWGFIDNSGKIVIPLEFEDRPNSFSEGLALVKFNYKRGFIDREGNRAIEIEWDYAEDFSEGLALVIRDKKMGYIDKSGAIAIDLQFAPASLVSDSSFSEGLAYVRRNGESQFIDKEGNTKITGQWEAAKQFSEGMAAVQIDKKWGFIAKDGSLAIEPRDYSLVGSFRNGLALVMRDGKRGFIDKNGKVVIPIELNLATTFFDERAMFENNDRWGFIDREGNEVVSLDSTKFVRTGDWGMYSEGVGVVEINGNLWFLDKTGKQIAPPFNPMRIFYIPEREWTNDTGIKMTAAVTGVKNDNVIFLQNGKEVAYRLDKLIEEDRRIIGNVVHDSNNEQE